MNNHNFLFYVYLFFVFLILSLFSFFLSFQLKMLTLNFSQLIRSLNFFKARDFFSEKNYIDLFYLYLARGNYFLCISLSELFLENNVSQSTKVLIYVSIARVYTDISIWCLAEYYYLEALSISYNDISIMSSLAKIYSFLGDKVKAQLFYEKILFIDPNYSINRDIDKLFKIN